MHRVVLISVIIVSVCHCLTNRPGMEVHGAKLSGP